MNRNTLYLLIAVLVVALAVLGWLYWDNSQKNRITLEVGNGAVTLETN
ncbi:MAG: hypothetical protein WEB63_00730 [Cucumibacter sp.]